MGANISSESRRRIPGGMNLKFGGLPSMGSGGGRGRGRGGIGPLNARQTRK